MNAYEIATSVKSGESSALSVLDESLDSIEKQNEEINAFVNVTYELAKTQAHAVDEAVKNGDEVGILAGVPIAIKDIICIDGVETTAGSSILKGWIPPYSATVIDKLVKAGAVVVGKTNMDEFAMGSSNETSCFGKVLNPVDKTRVPGGSSGGSAASVAAGMTAVSIGTDTGGSIRQPSAFCGTVGIKPTYGRVSRYGVLPFASSLDQVGPIAGNVKDAALILEAIAGFDKKDSTSLNAEVPNYQDYIDRGAQGLRVGVISEMMGEGISADVLRAVRRSVEELSASGAVVEEVSLPSLKLGLSAYYIIAPAEASSNLARFDGVRYGLRVDASDLDSMYAKTRAAGFGDEVKRRIMLGTYVLSSGYYDAYYSKAQKVRTLIMQEFNNAYKSFDVLISPTAPTTAFKFGENSDDPLAMYLNDVCTIPTNLAGHPAMSVPCGRGSDGLPIGLQVLAPALAETTMIQVAAEVERAVAAR